MKEFVRLRAETVSYLKSNNDEDNISSNIKNSIVQNFI